MGLSEFFDYLNPFRYVSSEGYIRFWEYLFSSFLQGFWARFFAVLFFILAIYVGLRRRSVRGAVIFYILSFLLAYAGGVYVFFKEFLRGVRLFW